MADDMPSPATPPRMSVRAQARLRQMVDTHFDFVWRSLRGLGVPAAGADDGAQQVFWIAAQKLEAITVGSERSFLFATARGIAANARRGRARRREVQDDDAIAVHTDSRPDPEQIAVSTQARALLDRILEDLPEDLRTIFVLFELEGMSMAEIATLLELPSGTVASRLRRAREIFQGAAKRLQAIQARGDRL
jgi:RNA polymerase sigma-70 factor (ECF subfamily)